MLKNSEFKIITTQPSFLVTAFIKNNTQGRLLPLHAPSQFPHEDTYFQKHSMNQTEPRPVMAPSRRLLCLCWLLDAALQHVETKTEHLPCTGRRRVRWDCPPLPHSAPGWRAAVRMQLRAPHSALHARDNALWPPRKSILSAGARGWGRVIRAPPGRGGPARRRPGRRGQLAPRGMP